MMTKFLGTLLLMLISVPPLIITIIVSLQDYGTPRIPTIGEMGTRWYVELADGHLLASIQISLKTAGLAAILATATAWIGAAAEHRWKLKYPNWLIFLAFVPCLLPPLILGFALKLYFGLMGWQDGELAVVLAHGAFCTPIAFAIMRSAYKSVRQSVIDAAYNLGASKVEALKVAVIPQMVPPFVMCLFLTFLFSWSEFAIAWYIGGMDPTFSVAIRSRMAGNITPEVYAATVVSIVITLSMLCLTGWVVMKGIRGIWNVT